MWHTWVHGPATPNGDKPRCWWRQLERESRAELPFAHLFPRPPAHAAPRATEAESLVRELTSSGPREPSLEEIVQQHRIRPPERTWQAVEAWQIVSIGRLDAQESLQWGEEDGPQVVEWFDRGDLDDLTANASRAVQGTEEPEPTPDGWRGWILRLRRWLQPEQGYELANEF